MVRKTHPGIVLLARMASTRLPGKALQRVGQWVILEHCLRRLMAGGVARVVLATTTQPEDDALVAVARNVGVSVFRGDSDDVLGRTLRAAREFGLDPVVRATGDNPFVDIQAAGRLLAALRASKADYVREEGLPYGAAVEAMTTSALQQAAEMATDAADREHVTTFIRRRTDLFRIVSVTAPTPLCRPSLRLTVDTPEDLAWVRTLFGRVGSEYPSLRRLIEAAGQRVQVEVAS
jgi:spore coat polysaccharide biosynthesis protein SpsF